MPPDIEGRESGGALHPAAGAGKTPASGRPNAVILTPGLSGSSVVSALLTRAGYWAGDTTFRKPDYDTHENLGLVEINKRILSDLDVGRDYESRFRPADLALVEERMERVDWAACREFLLRCECNRPWVWKDPRLWITIRVWSRLLDLSTLSFVVVERDPFQQWVAMTLRRQVQTYGYARRYHAGILRSIETFLADRGLSCLRLRYEDLIRHPESQLARLNTHLGTALESADLEAVYRGRLHRTPRGPLDVLRAIAIHAKNYGHRQR